MGKPDFLVVGARKSATTWLHDCLSHHPGIFVPPEKEVHFFCPDECPKSRRDRGVEWYEEIFPDDEGIVPGELSVDYMYYRDSTAEEIAELYPSTKLIFLLRNPVDRAYSAYWMKRHSNPGMDEFRAYIDEDHPFIDRGFYYRQIERFLHQFPEDQIEIFFHDDLVEDSEALIQDVFRFLGVDDTFVPPTLGEKVGSTRVFSSPVTRLAYQGGKQVLQVPVFLDLWRWLKRKTPIRRLLFGADGSRTTYPEMEEETRERLLSIYREENRKLFDLVGRKLDSWQR